MPGGYTVGAGIPADEFSDYCLEIALDVYGQWGADPDEDGGAFEEFRRSVVEPAVAAAMGDAVQRALREFPRDAAAFADYRPRR